MGLEHFKFDTDYLMDGELENMGGTDSTVFIALSRHIKTWPLMKANPANDTEVATLQNSFVMAEPAEGGAANGFMQCYSSPTKTGFDGESQGEIDGKSLAITGEIHYPGNGIDAVALARKLNNAHGVAIFTDGANNRMVVGSQGRPARFAAAVMNGKAATDAKEVVITVTADAYGVFKYNGVIPLLGGGEIPAIVETP
jgi:hypothetical protein